MMAAGTRARKAHIANDAADSPTRDENARTFGPNTIQFSKKTLILLDVTHLLSGVLVFL